MFYMTDKDRQSDRSAPSYAWGITNFKIIIIMIRDYVPSRVNHVNSEKLSRDM